MNQIIKRVLIMIVMIILLLGVPRLAGAVANQFDYQAFDPDGAYAWISVHHVVQALVFLFLILLLMRLRPWLEKIGMTKDWQSDFYLGAGHVRLGFKLVGIFTLFFLIYTTGAFVTTLLTRQYNPFPYPVNALNISGHLGFQLLLSGPSEELIFRAFAMTIFAIVIPGRILKSRLSHANWVAALIFAVAHISFTFAPFTIGFSTFQLIFAFVLGLFYGDVLEKSKSVYYPMMMHSIANVIMVTVTLILGLIIG